jgi:hypothetical protein
MALWQQQQHTVANGRRWLRQIHIFENLGRRKPPTDMQRMIQALARGHTRLADLISVEAEDNRKLNVQEAAKTRENVTDNAEANHSEMINGFDNLKIARADDSHRKAVMDSLFFPEIYARLMPDVRERVPLALGSD